MNQAKEKAGACCGTGRFLIHHAAFPFSCAFRKVRDCPCETPRKGLRYAGLSVFPYRLLSDQYMPPMSGEAGIGGFFSGMSATRLSVVSTMEDTDAAFSIALRQTLVGSTMPSSIMSP